MKQGGSFFREEAEGEDGFEGLHGVVSEWGANKRMGSGAL